MIRFISKNNKLGQFIAQILLLFVLFFTCTEAFCKTLKKFDNGDLQSIEELYEFEIEIQKKSENSTESDPTQTNGSEKNLEKELFHKLNWTISSPMNFLQILHLKPCTQIKEGNLRLHPSQSFRKRKDLLIQFHCFIFYEFSVVKNPNYGFFNN